MSKAVKCNEIDLTDEIIFEMYKKIIQKIKNEEEVKVGDWIKMVEFKRKLTPADAEQKKFWKMLDKIRKEELNRTEPEKTKGSAEKESQTKTGKKKKIKDEK